MFYLFFSGGAELKMVLCPVFHQKSCIFQHECSSLWLYSEMYGRTHKAFHDTWPNPGHWSSFQYNYNHPNTNHLLKSSELLWQVQVCWTPGHISPFPHSCSGSFLSCSSWCRDFFHIRKIQKWELIIRRLSCIDNSLQLRRCTHRCVSAWSSLTDIDSSSVKKKKN